MSGRRLGLLATVGIVAVLVLGAGMAVGASDGPHASGETDRNLSATGAENLTVVDFDWPSSCPDEGTSDSVLNEYFDGDIAPNDDNFHLDNANDADDTPPAGGCVLRTEGGDVSIVSIPGGQPSDISYYPQRGDTISWNHYVHKIDPFGGSNPSDFEFRFGVQNTDNYYFVTVAADETPLEFVLGEVSDGAVVAEDRVGIGDTLEAATFQPVAIDWTGPTIEATFDGAQTVSIDSDSYDDGGIGFQRQGTQGIINSYANLVDAVTADTDSHLQIQSVDAPDWVAPDEDLTVEYTLVNEGEQTATESEVGLFVGSDRKDTDTDVAVEPGGTESGTLTFASAGEFEDGEQIEFSVELSDWNDMAVGSVDVAEPGNLSITDVEAPAEVDIGGSLTLDYVVENVGGREETGLVQLSVDEEQTPQDADEVTLEAGEAVGGTLTYDNISDAYSGGDILSWEVGFADAPENVDGTTEVRDPPQFALTEVEAPESIGIADDLTVEYRLTNQGGETGTESFVDLYVDGEDGPVDVDENITLVPGESHESTLTFDGVEEAFDSGETIEWSVELLDFDGSASGVTNVTQGPELVIESVTPPEEVGLNENLLVDYTVTNVGDLRGTESAVQLWVDGSLADHESDLLVLPGETVSGTLAYNGVSTSFGPGEEVPFTVELAEFGDSTSMQTDITPANGSGELYFTVSPPNPDAGDELLLEAGHYDSSKYYFWLLEDEEIGTGTAATTVIEEPGTYNISLVESDIPGAPVGETGVNKQIEFDEGELVVTDTQLQGFDTPVFPEIEEERPVELTVETVEGQEFDDGGVTVEINGVSTTLFATDPTGAERTYTGTVNVNNIQEDTEATVQIEAFGNSYSDTKQVAVRDTPDWLDWVLENEEWFDVIEETEDGYKITLDLFDTTVVVDSGTSPYWDEDINVSLSGSGTFEITPEGMDLSASVDGGAGIAGTYASADIDPSASFGYNLSLLEAELLTSIMLERDIFQQDIGLDPLYENLPSPVADNLPSCVVGAEASVQGELSHYTQFVDGINPFDNLEEMALQGQPTLPIGAEATCGPASVTVDSEPTAQAAALFEPSVTEFEVYGAGAKADVTVDAQLSVDLWFFSGSESASWTLFEWEAIDGEDPFEPFFAPRGGPQLRGPVSGADGSGLVRERAGAETAPLSGVPTVDAGLTADTLSPDASSATTVRLTDRSFDDTDPVLASLGDESALLWSSEPAATGQREPSNLAVRVGSGTDWSEPVTITENANHEDEPALGTAEDGSALAAWTQFEDANRDVGEIEDQFFQEYEIAIASAADPADADSWTAPTKLTDGDAYEYAPSVVSVGADQWLVVWDRNTAANLSDLSAEEVGYALVSTAGDGLTVETQGTIADARAPDVGVSDGEVHLAFHRPGSSLGDGEVVRGTLDPTTGTFQPVGTHTVSGFNDLAVAGDRVVWADGSASDPSISTAVAGLSATSGVPLSTETTRLADLELAARGDRTVLTYQADAPNSESTERDLFVQVYEGGSWSSELQLARADLEGGAVTLSGANPVATAEGAVVPYVVSESAVDSSNDLFLVERPYEPTHALSATIDTPENVSVGEPVTVEATVENVAVAGGDEPATLRVTDGTTVVETAEVGPLGPGETATVELTPAVPDTGDLVVTVDGADPATDDGAFNQTVTETLLTPALVPGEVTVTRLNESTSELAITVTNTGAVDADQTTVALRDEGETVTTLPVPAVAGGERVTVTTTFDPDALARSSSETVVLDPAGELADAAVEERTRSVWAGQPNVVVTDEVSYYETPAGQLLASLVLGNEGATGATVSLSAIDEESGETLGRSAVELEPAVGDTSRYRTVNVLLPGAAVNDTVLFDATPVERPDADTGTTGTWDEVGPVLSGFTPDPVVGNSPPGDLDLDGLYRDVNGDGSLDETDVSALFEQLSAHELQQNAWAFGFAGGDLRQHVGVADVQALYEQVQGGDTPDSPEQAGDVTVSLEPAETGLDVGAATTVDVVVEGASGGIAAAEFAVEVDGPVTMTDVDAVDTAYSRAELGADGDRLVFAAATGADALAPGKHTVATVTVVSEGPGTATLSPVVDGFPGGVLAGPAQPYAAETDGAALSVGEGELAVDIVEAPDTPVGEAVDVTVNVTNVGPTAASQSLTVELGDGPGTDSTVETELELSGGESIEETLSVPTDPTENAGSYEVTVATADDSDSDRVEVYPPALGGAEDRPRDLTGDGLYRDFDGDGEFTIFDVQGLFTSMSAAGQYPAAFNFDDSENPAEVTIFDVQAMFIDLAS